MTVFFILSAIFGALFYFKRTIFSDYRDEVSSQGAERTKAHVYLPYRGQFRFMFIL